MDYKKEKEVFSANLMLAARSYYLRKELAIQCADDMKKYKFQQSSELFKALNLTPSIWNAFDYSLSMSFVIDLGKIFDKNVRSHSLSSLLKISRSSEDFKKNSLYIRKITLGLDSDSARNYVDRSYEMTMEDWRMLSKEKSKLQNMWDKLSDVRGKIYAHSEKMSWEDKVSIYKAAQFSIFEEIIVRLLRIEYILDQAYLNGRKPCYDVDFKNNIFSRDAYLSIQKLLQTLILKSCLSPSSGA